MKTIKYLLPIFLLTITFFSCSTEDDDEIFETNPVSDLKLVKSIISNEHTIEVYSPDSQFTIGYNELSVRIKDNATDTYFENPTINWMPMMHMTAMSHSCPKSALTASAHSTVKKGFIIFQMPGNETEYWDLKFTYEVDGGSFETTERIDVLAPSDNMKRINVFVGSDETRYVLAMVGPKNPEVMVNDFTSALYKMENMMTFTPVENYMITVDPRMPGMGNHSSPNNEDLTYNSSTQMYDGKLSLTMTGYWKVNLMLYNEDGELLKGEEVTETNTESSLFFDFEF